MGFIKGNIRRLFEYSGPGNWIYTTRILAWTFDPGIVRQLPLGMRLFCRYVRAYSRLVGTRTIIFGHGVYRLLRPLGNPPSAGPNPLVIAGQQVWLDLDDPGALWAIQELSNGSALSSLVESLAYKADVFVDIGANQGIFSAIASRTLQTGATIIAIEPQPRLAACIERTLQASGVQHRRVLNIAVSDLPGTLELVVPVENQGEAYLRAEGRESQSTIMSEVAVLDDVLGDVDGKSRVVVKMDIEGSELDALRGGRAFFRRCRPTLIMELNPGATARYGHRLDDLAQTLIELGYQRWALVEHPEDQHSVCSLPRTYCDIVLYGAESLE